MQSKTIIQAVGIVGLVGLAITLALDGVKQEIVVLLVVGILLIAAPEAVKQLDIPLLNNE